MNQRAAPHVRSGFAPTDDGEQLYWRATGQGPAMVCCNGVGVSTFFWKYLNRYFSDRMTVIQWDYRGHGRSSLPRDIPVADLSMERNARDLRDLLAALHINEPVVLVGHSMGCQVILEYHHQWPERVRAIIPMLGTFARPLDTFMDSKHSRAVFELIRDVAGRTGRARKRFLLPLYASPMAYTLSRYAGIIDRYYASRTDIGRYTDHLGHMDPDVFIRMASLMAEHDLTDHLPTIRVPVLVIGGEKDVFTPLHRARRMAELIPGAEMLVIPDGSHAAIVEHPELINARVERFLQERVFPDLPSRPPEPRATPGDGR